MTRSSCAVAVASLLGSALWTAGCDGPETPPDSPATSQPAALPPAASRPAADEVTISVPPTWRDIGALVARLKSDDPMTRVRAIRALGRIEDGIVLPEMARSGDPVLPLAPPLMVAGRTGPAGAHIYILDPVSGTIVRYRPAAARVEWMARAVPALIAATTDKDACVRYAAVWALADMDDPPAHVYRAINCALADKDRWVRQAAGVAYAKLTRPDAAIPPFALFPSALEKKVYRLILRQGDPKELAALGPKALPVVLKWLTDGPTMAWDSPYAFMFAGMVRPFGPPAVEALGELLKHGNRIIRSRAAVVLGAMGPQGAPALKRALESRDVRIRTQVLEDLARLTLWGYGPKGRDMWLSVRQRVLPKLVVPLGNCLTEDEPLARERAAALLLAAKSREIAVFVPALRDRRAPVRQLAIKTMARMVRESRWWLGGVLPAPDAVAALAEIVKDKDSALRIKAIDMLGWFGPAAKAAVPVLETATKDRDLMTALSAVEALKAIRRKDEKDKGR